MAGAASGLPGGKEALEMRQEIILEPHQKKFVQAAEMYPALFGGVGNGKTLAACLKCIEHATQTPKNLGLVGRLTYPELKDSTFEVYKQALSWLYPKEAYTINKAELTITYWNESIELFRHLDKPKQLLSMNLGYFYIDQAEEVDEEAFLTLQSRLRRRGVQSRQGMLTGNPAGYNWVYFKYGLDKAPSGIDEWQHNEDYRMFSAPTFANRNNLPANYIEQLQRSYSQEWFDRYVAGSWDTFEGQIFDISQISGYDSLPEIKIVLMACDPAISKESAACNTAFAQLGVGADGHIYDLCTVANKWSFYETLDKAGELLKLGYNEGMPGMPVIRPAFFGVENTAYQQALYEACQRYFEDVTVVDLKADKDKYRRAKSVSHIIAKGLFHTNNKELLSELSAFKPDQKGKEKKDRVDALVHCLHMVQKYAPIRFEDHDAERKKYQRMSSGERFLKLSLREEQLELMGRGDESVTTYDPRYSNDNDEFY